MSGFTVEQKAKMLDQRREELVRIGQKIDRVLESASGKSTGCFGGLRRILARLGGCVRAANGATVEVQAAANVATTASRGSKLNTALFGLAGARQDPAQRLDEAAQVMRARIGQLEARATEHRVEAKRLLNSGQRAAALRALKKAKTIESQVVSNQAAVDAVEQQVDMLAQVQMQKTVTNALASTNKSMKKEAKSISKAEAAIDDAAEMRDMASDLGSVMAEFAANSGTADFDDDELLAELDDLVLDPPLNDVVPAAVPAAAVTASSSSSASISESSVLSSAHALPAVPTTLPAVASRKTRSEERTGLLEAAAGEMVAGV